MYEELVALAGAEQECCSFVRWTVTEVAGRARPTRHRAAYGARGGRTDRGAVRGLARPAIVAQAIGARARPDMARSRVRRGVSDDEEVVAADDLELARRLGVLVESVHAVVYFAPEPKAAYAELGLRGYWRGYFAGRAAPLGAPGPSPRCSMALPPPWSAGPSRRCGRWLPRRRCRRHG